MSHIQKIDRRYSEDNKGKEGEEKSTYDKIVSFFDDQKSLKLSNFELFINESELNSVFQYDDIKIFWRVFTNSENEEEEYDFNTTLEFVEKIGEKISEQKDQGDEDYNNNDQHSDKNDYNHHSKKGKYKV